MAELAHNYHETLQTKESTRIMSPEERERTRTEFLGGIPANQKLPDPERTPLNWKVTEEQVVEALKRAKEGSATGLDGCPYELWKHLQQRHNKQ